MKKYLFLTALLALSLSACDSDNNEQSENQDLIKLQLADVMTTSEDGSSVSVGVTLGAQPQGMVAFSLSSDNPKEGVVSPSTLTFNAENWNVTQTFTVTGVADGVVDGDQKYHVILSVLSTDDIAFADLSKTFLQSQSPRAFTSFPNALCSPTKIKANRILSPSP